MRLSATIIVSVIVLTLVTTLGYTIAGTSSRVEEIKQRAPQEMAARDWKILRYEGFQRGAWGDHGGRVWYHVANVSNPNTQYRVFITLWEGELHFHYNQPEQLQRVEVNYP